MKNRPMLGLWRYVLTVPTFLLHKQIARGKRRFEREHDALSDEERQVHHFVVKALPGTGKPLSPDAISEKLDIPSDRVNAILDSLEKRMVFLYRNKTGEVTWAYPVTVDKTPHRITFRTGEQLYAAWAADAFATPFVQGKLRQEHLTVSVQSECAHCSREMEIEIDSDLNYTVKKEGCEPVIFIPDVNLFHLEDDSIIDSFWTACVFFWSEEHAREHRKKEHRIRGAYVGATRMVEMTRIIQSAIFGFDK